MQRPAVSQKTNFYTSLQTGKVGESLIANWFKRQGYSILPVYEVEYNTGKGPRMFTAKFTELVAPDMMVFSTDPVNFLWVEAKHKTAFAWNRIRQIWVTGIDTRHYEDYLRVKESTGLDVLLLFLQRGGGDLNNPGGITPSGLFGGEITYLSGCVNHQWKTPPNVMTYWRKEDLRFYATYEEVARL